MPFAVYGKHKSKSRRAVAYKTMASAKAYAAKLRKAGYVVKVTRLGGK